ncbi:phosphoadenosine phosphosulfate reductase domain-containing protein [Pseudomonas aeruginosa]|uniref:phosphoadenosine phosphosulfate reductase domain-containing protein n=1 Tax=Pseudomonas aeruginosa TaxID=287 RepID=UPI0013C48A52|nr:phosphoadenosine phosphosulfate reductase family protein [Pseudomonas aeruginosa]
MGQLNLAFDIPALPAKHHRPDTTITNKIVVSVSGGRSSMFMARMIQLHWADEYEIVFIFCNTGWEHPRTLEFVKECAEHWGMNIVWLEAEINPKRGKVVLYRVVNFQTASRCGRPFREMIQKLGLPNKAFPFCTRDLKTRPSFAYIRDALGWGGEGKLGTNYYLALGIRADEPKRLRATPGRIYPLAGAWESDKQDVLDWWEDQPFDLNRPLLTGETIPFPERYGNCVWCWKKSLRKHLLNLHEHPEWYEFPAEMEQQYGHHGAGFTGEPRVFFREGRSTQDLIKLAEVATPDERMGSRFGEDDGCSESCEAF